MFKIGDKVIIKEGRYENDIATITKILTEDSFAVTIG